MGRGGYFYKILPARDWRAAESSGVVPYAAVDERDGYMHMSTGEQVLETARLHFKGQTDLVALEIDPALIDGDVRLEPSRGGALFPHLYGALSIDAVLRARPLIEANGEFSFADEARA
ncbi:MAG TPA: DUF952 domain-containing protein [Amphiplicatus sp.]|nr:DUF952 domain-containing protein [Amphiplicatus sp.]